MKPQRAEADSVLEKLPMWIDPVEPVEGRQPRRRRVLEIGEDIVLDDGEAELLGELQHPVRGHRRQRCAGRIVDRRSW